MEVEVHPDAKAMGQAAAASGAKLIRQAITERGSARIVVATGASQFEVLAALIQEPEIDWSVVTGFHLDEYIDLPITHEASFRKYLKERFVDHVPLKAFHYINGEGDPQAECDRVGELIGQGPIDVAFIGIGENAHVAFNDPPADFETTSPYIVVDLDDACRQQQFGEGWFPTFDAVPRQAISMSVQQILKSQAIMCSVPDERKAKAVQGAVEGDITNEVPASILQKHARTTLFLDEASASLLNR